jgi:hypothetical protein
MKLKLSLARGEAASTMHSLSSSLAVENASGGDASGGDASESDVSASRDSSGSNSAPSCRCPCPVDCPAAPQNSTQSSVVEAGAGAEPGAEVVAGSDAGAGVRVDVDYGDGAGVVWAVALEPSLVLEQGRV